MVTFIIPTLNSAKVLKSCLESIKFQTQKNKIIIADGGSTDDTLQIAQKYNCQIVKNKLKTGEAGKAIALGHITTSYVAFVDSDNILPTKNWLNQMIISLQKHPKAIGAEPWAFTYRNSAGFIERYSALVGANDPYAFILGNFDRLNYLDHQWTHLKIPQKNFKKYLLLTLNPKKPLPTIGANGTVFKTSFLKKQLKSDYLFDIDLISSSPKTLYFIKTKNSIIHTFCESSISKFIKKQTRRLSDYYQYQSIRQFNWSQQNRLGITKFIFHTVFISPFLALAGFIKKPDPAWFFHPLACWISLFVYTQVTIKHSLKILKPLNRNQWQQ